MKYLKSYNESKTDVHSITQLTNTEINLLCRRYGIYHADGTPIHTINSDGSIDVDGDVGLNNQRLTKLPLKFRNVSGDFYCSYNDLTSLEGCPQTVGGDFYCLNNQLTSLEGLPEIIGGDINCIDNYISDFRGVPELFEGGFYCEGNPIDEIYTLFLQENNVATHVYDSKCIQWINEFDVIQRTYNTEINLLCKRYGIYHADGTPIHTGLYNGKVVLDRLEEVFHQLGMNVPENITFKSYEII